MISSINNENAEFMRILLGTQKNCSNELSSSVLDEVSDCAKNNKEKTATYTESFEERLMELCKTMDANGDGKVSAEEISNYVYELSKGNDKPECTVIKKQSGEVFNQLDINKDGVISTRELELERPKKNDSDNKDDNLPIQLKRFSSQMQVFGSTFV